MSARSVASPVLSMAGAGFDRGRRMAHGGAHWLNSTTSWAQLLRDFYHRANRHGLGGGTGGAASPRGVLLVGGLCGQWQTGAIYRG